MKRAVVFLILLAGCSSPRICFEEVSHDFGPVKAGTKLSHTFIFRNTGNATLRIERLQAG